MMKTVRFGTFLALTATMIAPATAHPGAHETAPSPTASAPSVTAAASTAVETVQAFHAALTRGDTAGALGLMAENAVIFESGNVERSRAEYAAHHLASDAAFSAAVRRTLVDRSSGEDNGTAWVMSVETVDGTFRNRAINSRSVETMLLRRIDGQWRISHIHWSSADK